MPSDAKPIKGRGATENLPNRFERLHYALDPEAAADEQPAPATQFFRDQSRSIITTNDSPDVGFDASINPYRGCEHGCVYCYARPTHEYLGWSAGLDFETKILVKEQAPELLRRELLSERWQPRTLGISGVTDPYQPIEARLQLTRRCLEVLAEFRNPVVIVTKNRLVTRDRDLLARLAQYKAAAVFLSITTLDGKLARVLEPRTTQPSGRLAAIADLTQAGIPTGVLVAPVIPGLNDHEIPSILESAAAAGARYAGYVMLRLPHGVADLVQDWLAKHVPEKKDKVLGRLRDMRAGRLNDGRFRSRMRGEGVLADTIRQFFRLSCRAAGFADRGPDLSAASFRRPNETPPMLFDE